MAIRISESSTGDTLTSSAAAVAAGRPARLA
ncbi:hypothetical protein Pcinc_029297, partial [Petrolisthes cinctipes]